MLKRAHVHQAKLAAAVSDVPGRNRGFAGLGPLAAADSGGKASLVLLRRAPWGQVVGKINVQFQVKFKFWM